MPGAASADQEVVAQKQQRSKQDEYRRELELQIKMKEEQKKQRDLKEKLLDERESIQPRVPGVPGFVENQRPP